MKQFIKYILTILLTALIIFEAVVLGIIAFPQGVFKDSYQSVIVEETNEPKIIIVCGSSSAFGLNQAMLEEETGYKVVDLGLHAGFGHLFYSELAKENINEGDIVLLSYEYGWQDGFDTLGQDLIMSGIDENIDMYKHIPVEYWDDFIGYIFKYAETKYSYIPPMPGDIYSRAAFDSETTQMTMYRGYVMDYPNNIALYGQIDLTGVTISESTIEYLKGFKEYAEQCGASVYFISPPVLKQAVVCDYSEFDSLVQQEEELIGIPFISNPVDYFFEDELMSNAIYHCSSEGEIVRTELLVEDLKRAGVI